MNTSWISAASYLFPTTIGRYVAHQFLKTTPYKNFSKDDYSFLSLGTQHRGPNHSEYWTLGEGKPLIFVHGWNGHGIQFRATAQKALEQGYRVILWTGPGHGDSGPKRSNLGIFFRALMETCKILGKPHALIGHSFGAMASALSVAHGICPEFLVMCGGPAKMLPVVSAVPKHFKLSARSTNFFHAFIQKNAKLSPAEADLYQLKSLINCKTLWIHDAHDKEISVNEVKQLKPHWPELQVKITEHLGHRRILKSPEFTNAVLEFIKDS